MRRNDELGARIIDGRGALVRYVIPVPVRGLRSEFGGGIVMGFEPVVGGCRRDGCESREGVNDDGGAPMREPDAARAFGVVSDGRLLALELLETAGARMALVGRLSWNTEDCAKRSGRGIDARGAGREDGVVTDDELAAAGVIGAGVGIAGRAVARGFGAC